MHLPFFIDHIAKSRLLQIIFFVSFSICFPALAQQENPSQLPAADTLTDFISKDSSQVIDNIPQKDLADVVKGLLKIKQAKPKSDSVTTKPSFSIIPAVGYTLTTRFAGTISGNSAFRLKPSARLSTVTASAAYTQNSQFTVPIQSSIWTGHGHYNIVGDYRFYKYPQSTFGLGSNSWIENEDPMDYSYFRFYEVVMRHIRGNLFAGVGYIIDSHQKISEKGLEDHSVSDYAQYGPMRSSISSGFTLNAVYDERDNSINPYKGFYTSIQYRDNVRGLGSTVNWSSIILDVRKYVRLSHRSNNILAFWSYNWLVLSGKPPYLDLPSTSWDAYSSTGVGYIQGRFRGAQMVYLETQYRFRITRNGLFGGVIFLNAQCFSGAPSTPLQSIQPGFGPGLRIKLNKTSRTNIAIDYGFGKQGSQGLFINIAELF